MGYRHEHRDHGMDVVLPIDNGTISHISIPCFRRPPLPPGRHRDEHNHQGWPSPDSPDDTCQGPWDEYEDDIDLLEEGYDSVEVSLLDQPEGFSIAGQIDGNKVRLTITAVCEAAETECVNVPFAVYLLGSEEVEGEDEPVVTMRDLAAKGVIHIVEGPVGDSVPWVAPTTESRIEESVTEHVNELVGQIDERIDGQLEQLDDRISEATGNGSITVSGEGIISSDADVWGHLATPDVQSTFIEDYCTGTYTDTGGTHEYDMSDYFMISTYRLYMNAFRKRVYGVVYISQRQALPAGLADRKYCYIAYLPLEYTPSCMSYNDRYEQRDFPLDGNLVFPGYNNSGASVNHANLWIQALPISIENPLPWRATLAVELMDTDWSNASDNHFYFYIDYPVGGDLQQWSD